MRSVLDSTQYQRLKVMGGVLLLNISVFNSVVAQEQKPAERKLQEQTEKAKDSKAPTVTTEINSTLPQIVSPLLNNQKTETEATQTKESTIDWGDWGLQPTPTFGVGITGDIEAQINQLDQSNLLENATGVATTDKHTHNLSQNKNQTNKQDLKKTMVELEAMEAKVKKEIEDDTEF